MYNAIEVARTGSYDIPTVKPMFSRSDNTTEVVQSQSDVRVMLYDKDGDLYNQKKIKKSRIPQLVNYSMFTVSGIVVWL